MYPRCCCLFQLPCLIHFAVFSNLHLLRPPVYSGRRVVALRKISYILGFIFNVYSSFVNPLLHLILCVSCHAVADKLLVEWLPRDL